MSKYDTVLYSDINQESGISLMTLNPNTERPITVDGKQIVVPEELQIIGVTNDHKAEVVHFELPATYDGIDLSQYPCFIDYLRPDGFADFDEITDLEVIDGMITFTWYISKIVTRYAGRVYFSVRFQKDYINPETGKTDVLYRWATEKNEAGSFKVLQGLNVDEYLAENYPSELEKWRETMEGLQSQIEVLIHTTKKGDSAYQSYLNTGGTLSEKEWVASLRGPQGIQGPKGDAGPIGMKGDTPIKYVDYWTSDDKAELISDLTYNVLNDINNQLNIINGEDI